MNASDLKYLEPKFLKALEDRQSGRVDAALEAFRDLLKVEPRLPEPRMELARILLEIGRLDDAEAEAREALRVLEAGGQWNDDLPEHVVRSLAWSLVGEILKERAATDDVVFGDPDRFKEIIAQSRAAFAKAAELDPADTVSGINAAELGEGTEES